MPVVEFLGESECCLIGSCSLGEPSLFLYKRTEPHVGGAHRVPVTVFLVNVEGPLVRFFGLREPPLPVSDPAKLVIGVSLTFLILSGLEQLKFCFVMSSGHLQKILGVGRVTCQVMQYGKFYLLCPVGGPRVAGNGVLNQLAAGVLLLGLVEVFLQRLD